MSKSASIMALDERRGIFPVTRVAPKGGLIRGAGTGGMVPWCPLIGQSQASLEAFFANASTGKGMWVACR